MDWKDELKKECRKKFTNNFTNNNEFIEHFDSLSKVITLLPIDYWVWFVPTIESLLKKQRENCMLEFQAGYKKRLGYSSISINIDHAPEPERGTE